MKRWQATITYRTENGSTQSVIEFEEFEDPLSQGGDGGA